MTCLWSQVRCNERKARFAARGWLFDLGVMVRNNVVDYDHRAGDTSDSATNDRAVVEKSVYRVPGVQQSEKSRLSALGK